MTDDAQRLDKWLWSVRIFKTRALSAKVISGKSVRISRDGQTLRTDKPAFKLRVGDTITVMRGPRLFVLDVLRLPERRVSATEAALCYNDQAAPPPGETEDNQHAR
ncbi:MAG: RNA-binding S4 domain-containing protein [Pseudomonadota bacterium]